MGEWDCLRSFSSERLQAALRRINPGAVTQHVHQSLFAMRGSGTRALHRSLRWRKVFFFSIGKIASSPRRTQDMNAPDVPLRLPTYAPPETLASLRFQERIAMNPDIQLRHDVFAQLNWDPAVNACDVDVRVTNGVVTLVGRVADEAQRAAAERAARRTEGLTTLLNGLTVRPAAVIAR